MKKIPLRRCLVTGERLPKKELIRVVKSPEGRVLVDPTGKANGRGAYLKKDREIIARARQTGILAKVLKAEVPPEIYAELERIALES